MSLATRRSSVFDAAAVAASSMSARPVRQSPEKTLPMPLKLIAIDRTFGSP
jgi:hypothetical protein